MAVTAHPVSIRRRRLEVRGIVQGVGFRPFIFNLASHLRLTGFVLNTSAGVVIEAEGAEHLLEQFQDSIRMDAPSLAQIEEMSISDLDLCGEQDFSIHESIPEPGEFALVLPDVATCAACRADFGDIENRRHGYPFTNCTNCGPRYTIIKDIPYDRPSTTMAGFRMCFECQVEYEDPRNRRFHAQPNACPSCGPGLALAKQGSFIPNQELSFSFGHLSLSILADARKLLHDGNILAIKGLGGFLLCCDAKNDKAVRLLRARKKRSDKPFALMARDLDAVSEFSLLSSADCEVLSGPQRPIVILPRRSDACIADAVAPGNKTLGVMLPYTPLHHLLFGDSPDTAPEFTALVMTSGNISEEPIVVSNHEAWQRLGSVADWFLFHNRDIYMRVDDSVVRTFEDKPRLLRRSRGYVPRPIDLGINFEEILACGGELKNTFCLTKGHYAILSQHIGDLENYETLCFFNETLENLKKLFRVNPAVVAHDLHPNYMSTKLALQLRGLKKIGVQHHHAHIASCMAENGLKDKVIGVAFDGTGYGTDGQIWGGEFLTCDFSGFERRAHLRYVPLAGGDAAVRQPWRSALSHLQQTFGAESLPADLPLWEQVSPKHLELVEVMMARGLNTINTSSCGRLFDAVAAIIGLRQEVNFEGQAAIELEMIALRDVEQEYPFQVASNEPWQIDTRPMINAIVEDYLHHQEPSVISARFHNTLAAIIVEVCSRLRTQERLNRVCLSGGTFQNMVLLERATTKLRASGFEVFLHSKVPPNDGGIALGQAVIANQLVKQGD